MTTDYELFGEHRTIAISELRQALKQKNGAAEIVSVVGAGGKTTLIARLAEEYERAGERVLITTSTHIMCPLRQVIFIDEPGFCIQTLKEQLQTAKEQVIYVAEHCPDFDKSHKLKMPAEKYMQYLYRCGIPLLIEADGSKQLPCKVPAGHEPVIPKETTAVIGILSAGAVGKPIKSCCHRPELAAALLNKSVEDEIELSDLEKIAFSTQGLKKSVEEDMKYFPIYYID